jgi:hypothetical protein
MKLCLHPTPIANHPINLCFTNYSVAWELVQKVPCHFEDMVEDPSFPAAE